MKDARWALAKSYAEEIGLDFEDFTYEGWQKLLDMGQRHLEGYPSSVGYWASRFGETDDE